MRMPVASFAPLRVLGINNDAPPVGGYVLWLRSDTGRYQTVGGPPATADGDPVGQWQDRSAAANHLSQVGAARRPMLRLGQVNGLASVQFDGIDDFLNAAWSLSWPTTVFIVARMDAWVSGRYVYGGGAGDSADLYMSPASPSLRYYTGTSGSGDPIVSTLAVGAWGILRTWTSASQKSLRHNANAEVITAGVAGSQAGLTLGAHPNPTGYGSVEIAETIVYPSLLTASEEAAVRNYLNTRYAIF